MQLRLYLNKITQRATDLPNIILTGDFNLPSIKWLDGSGQLDSHPIYGVELNNLFLDLINDIGFEQSVTTPTRNKNILDLVLSTSPNVIDLDVTPGMSDHEAVVFYFDVQNKTINTKSEHKVALYHKANLENIKRDLLEFHNYFFEHDPYTQSVEQNWNKLKSAITDSITKHVPFKTMHPNSKLPWINKDIKRDMKKRKRYYNIAKQSKSANDWNAYRRIKNCINCKIKEAHTNYYTKMFDNSLNGNRRQILEIYQSTTQGQS